MSTDPSAGKYLAEQERIDLDKVKKIEKEKKIQGPIDREKIEQIENEKKKKKKV